MSLRQPVSKGDVHTVEVEKYADEGDGLAFIGGLAVFVEGADPGEKLVVKIEYVGETFARAEVLG